MSDAERDRMLREIHADVRVMATRVEEHHITLYGNGKPGLKADVQRIDQHQDECPARLAYSLQGRGLIQQIRGNWLALVALAVAVWSVLKK
jgi:hypothetical protein